MTSDSWLDHLPPWLAWGSIASTGAYTPTELLLMAIPLLLAALVQARGWSLLRWRRLVEVGTLVGFLAQVLARAGLLPTVVSTLFLLCGARLCLPRELPQRRQLLLMGFLLFLTTAITTSELDFLLWSLIWVAGAATVLLQQNWGQPAGLRTGPVHPPPFRLILPWTALAVLLASGLFVTLPRLRLGFRGLPAGTQGIRRAQAGLSDTLDLEGKGPIQSSREVALRVVPSPNMSPASRQEFSSEAGLLRCFVLEGLEGQRWVITGSAGSRTSYHWGGASGGFRPMVADFNLEPGLREAIPLPYGQGELEPPPGEELRPGRGGTIAFAVPSQRATTLQVAMRLSAFQREPQPGGLRLAHLTAPGLSTGSALRWSLKAAPSALPARDLAQQLTQALRTYRYTLDNPSGSSANPLQDFLEHSHAGHCEYFASALAIMLRQRGIPSRIANGYRLGPWIQEGGYFLVTQGEAHSWVEYYDDESGGWRVADPTPPAPPSVLGTGSFTAALTRWADTLRFRWDHDVVHFSDQSQVAGLEWLQARIRNWTHGKPSLPSPRWLAGAGALALLAWALRAGARQRRPGPRPHLSEAGRIRELAPLVRKLHRVLPPLEGETARAWLGRLAQAQPARSAALAVLAEEADAVAYGLMGGSRLKALAKAERRAWQGWTGP